MGRGSSGGGGGRYVGGGAGYNATPLRKVYESGGTDFVRDHLATVTGMEVVYVDVAKLDAAWSQETSFYIPPGGGGAEIGGRRAGFERFLETGRPVEMSRVFVDSGGRVSFGNGRHRFSIFRDRGRTVIPVVTDRGASARRLRQQFGVNPQ